jgi:hypothetical protein
LLSENVALIHNRVTTVANQVRVRRRQRLGVQQLVEITHSVNTKVGVEQTQDLQDVLAMAEQAALLLS